LTPSQNDDFETGGEGSEKLKSSKKNSPGAALESVVCAGEIGGGGDEDDNNPERGITAAEAVVTALRAVGVAVGGEEQQSEGGEANKHTTSDQVLDIESCLRSDLH
jgi:hypothetical protein